MVYKNPPPMGTEILYTNGAVEGDKASFPPTVVVCKILCPKGVLFFGFVVAITTGRTIQIFFIGLKSAKIS